MKHGWIIGGVLVALISASALGWADESEALTAQKAAAEATLHGSVWSISLVLMSENSKSKHPLSDALAFEDGQVSSEVLVAKGYPTTNYTLTIEKGVPVWQTMQTSSTKKGDVVFWRGELRGETSMRGILSLRSQKGTSEHFNFSGSPKAVPPPPPPAAVEVQSESGTTATGQDIVEPVEHTAPADPAT